LKRRANNCEVTESATSQVTTVRNFCQHNTTSSAERALRKEFQGTRTALQNRRKVCRRVDRYSGKSNLVEHSL